MKINATDQKCDMPLSSRQVKYQNGWWYFYMHLGGGAI
nr:MAG TPA: hypothetical protein [Caudoviricetes sp.]